MGLPNTIEQCDLVSYGIFGLIDAIEKFDNQRAIKFETYAITRIKGAIIDELRSIDWVPRSVRLRKARAIEKAYAKLEAQLLRTPTDAEVAKELGLSEGELQAQFSRSPSSASSRWMRCCRAGTVVSPQHSGTLCPTATMGRWQRSRSRRSSRSWLAPSTGWATGKRSSCRCTTTKGSPWLK